MPSERIVRSQINELIQTVLKSNVSPDTLTFVPAIPKTSLQLRLPLRIAYEDPSFFFEISFTSRGKFQSYFFPDNRFETRNSYNDTWSPVIAQFETWLAVVGAESSQPDPWALLDQGSFLKDAIPSASGAQQLFSGSELARLRGFLIEAKRFLVAEAGPTDEQLDLINERLDYLKQSAERQNKQDWAHTAVGVMFTIAIGLAMAPEQANRLLELTADFIKTIFMPLLK
jgi:hypothetical protein